MSATSLLYLLQSIMLRNFYEKSTSLLLVREHKKSLHTQAFYFFEIRFVSNLVLLIILNSGHYLH